MGTGAEVEIRLKCGTYRCFHSYDGNYSGIGTELWYFLSSLSSKQWRSLELLLRTEVKWVKEYDEADDAIRAYEGKYRYSFTNQETNQVKEILGDARLSPGFALKEVLEGRLRHMVHVKYEPDDSDALSDSNTCVGSDVSDSADIFQHALYVYSIDLPARKLRVDQEDEKNVGRWVEVPLLKDAELSLLSDFDIFELERTRRIHAVRALREGRSWDQRADPKLSRLAHFILHGDHKKKEQVLRNEVNLREVLPEGCGLWTHCYTNWSHRDRFVVWNLVIANRLPLRKKEWRKLRKAVRKILKADHQHDKQDLDLASHYNEGKKLEAWAAMKKYSGDEMGSFNEVEAVLTALYM